MLAVNLRSQAVVAAVGLCAVVGLMAASVGAVHAGAVQTEKDAAAAAELARAKELYSEHMQKAVHHAKRAAEATRSRLAGHLAQARARLAGGLRHRAAGLHEALQDGRSRMRAAPRIAMRHRGPGGGATAERVLRMADELELTDQQEEEIRQVSRQHRRAAIERNAAIEVAGLDLEELMRDPHTADLGAVEQQMQAIGTLRIQDRIANLSVTQRVWGALTAEQRDQLEDERHGAYFIGGDGPRAWSMLGDDFAIDIDIDDFTGQEWMNDFDFDFDFGDPMSFELWRWRDGQDGEHEWHDEEGEREDIREEAEEGEVKTNADSASSRGSVSVPALF